MSKTLFFLVTGLLGACASVPKFAPSEKIGEAGSYHEAVLLCHEYRLPSGAPRVVALKPILDCMEQAMEKPSAPATGPGVTFLIEFKDQYEGLSDSRFTPELARELELAIHALLRPIWRGTTGEYTEQEVRVIRKHFPITGDAFRIRSAKTTPKVVLDPKLEKLRARFAALLSPQGATVGVDPWIVKPGKDGSPGELDDLVSLCDRVRKLEIEVAHLVALWDDRKDLAEMNSGNVTAEGLIAEKVRVRYRTRLAEVSKQMSDVQEDVLKARRATGFQPTSCRSRDRA